MQPRLMAPSRVAWQNLSPIASCRAAGWGHTSQVASTVVAGWVDAGMAGDVTAAAA
jgi:hypothetical protein